MKTKTVMWDSSTRAMDERVLLHVSESPGISTRSLIQKTGARAQYVQYAIHRLEALHAIENRSATPKSKSWHPVHSVPNHIGGTMPKTQIFQHENGDVSVVTDAVDERDFLDGAAAAISQLKNGAVRPALAGIVDIVNTFRGYKSTVLQRRLLASGQWPHPSEKPAAEGGSPEPGVAE